MPFLGVTRALPGFPPVYVTWRQEIERPYRRCEHALALRVPWSGRAVVAGVWRRRLADEDERLAAIGFAFAPELDRQAAAGAVFKGITVPESRANPFREDAHVE